MKRKQSLQLHICAYKRKKKKKRNNGDILHDVLFVI